MACMNGFVQGVRGKLYETMAQAFFIPIAFMNTKNDAGPNHSRRPRAEK
jgi:hypothetical protein